MIYRQFLVAASIGLAAASRFFVEDEGLQLDAWEGFKRDFARKYHPSEETFRFKVFLKNLRLIDMRNERELAFGGQAVHGITRFADMTEEEFAAGFLGSVMPEDVRSSAEVSDIGPLPEGLKASKDWTGTYTTAVKDQGSCGSCWAFSAVEQIESDVMRTLGKTYILSPQQIVSCDKTSYGCQGGWTEHAYDYVKSAGGLEQNKDYPYSSPPTGTCKADASKFVVGVTGYTTIRGESNMANYVTSTGPLSICIDASSWSSYTGGIMSVCGRQVNHCVQAVGVDTSSAWKVRNSWGTGWGESGYIRLAYGQNTCNLTSDPTWAAVVNK